VLTDSQGRRVDFKNSIVVMTSNVGARGITERQKLGFSAGAEGGVMAIGDIRASVMADLKKAFRPEFLNRLDEIIVFHQLTRAEIRQVAAGMASAIVGRVGALGVTLEVDGAALDYLAEKGFDPIYGARPLRRAIQSSVEDAVAERLLDGRVGPGGTVRVTARDGTLVLE
jgi:ATP-dependent Clp protease ATP-binding subunit ClpC